jgi:Cu(I)/Ag(I) efflux system membrane fusion protein
MKAASIAVTLTLLAIAGAGGYGLYSLGMNRGMQMAAAPAAPAASPPAARAEISHEGHGSGDAKGDANANPRDNASPALRTPGERKVLYWHDPMVPGQRFDKPGKSPFMDMPLVPVYADEAGDSGKTGISPRMQQNLGIRTVEVTRGAIRADVSATGSVAYDEREVVIVQARNSGYVEQLLVRAPLDPVKKGQPLVDLYVPDWVAVQEEFFAVRRMQGSGIEPLIDAARQRMRLAGMSDDQVRAVEQSGTVRPRFTITAPIGGIVTELIAREGTTVMPGATLFRINGIGTIWVNAEVPETVAALVRPGIAVEATTPALPGKVFKGRVSRILPELNAQTRTIKARIELANPGGQLAPGMFATVSFAPAVRRTTLLVPTEPSYRPAGARSSSSPSATARSHRWT